MPWYRGRATMQQHADVFFQPRAGSMLLFLFPPAILSGGEAWICKEVELCPLLSLKFRCVIMLWSQCKM